MNLPIGIVARIFVALATFFFASFAHALTLSVSLNPDRVRPNEGLRASLTVTNNSGVAVSGVELRATVPSSGVNTLSQYYLSRGGTCLFTEASANCYANERVTWNFGTIPAGQAVTVTMPMVVANGAAVGSLITLPAEVLVNSVQAATISKSVTVNNTNALTLGLDEDQDAVVPGETLTYSLTYGNRSTSNVTGTTLDLPLPPGVTFVAASGGGTHNSGVVSWNLSTLLAGQSGRQQVIVTVNNGLTGGTVLPVDAAVLAGTSAVTGAELARATAVTKILTTPALGLAIEMNPDPVRPNEGLRSAFTVTNRTNTVLTGTVLRARVPTDNVNTFSQSYLSNGGTCISSDASANCYANELVTWNIGTLAPGQGVTVTMPMVVTNATASGELIVLGAEVVADGVPQMLATHTVAVNNTNALTLGLDEDQDAVAPGETLTYSLTYGNRSTSNVTGTTLAFPIPPGATLVGASGGTVSGGIVQWSLGTLVAGSGGRKTVTVIVNATPPAGLRLAIDGAQLLGTNSANAGPERAWATAVTRIIADNPIKLAVSVAPNPVQGNQTLTGTLRVTNSAVTSLTGVILQARVPADSVNTFNQSVLSGGTCISSEASANCYANELVTWNLGTLAPGQVMSVAMPMVVTSATALGRLIALDADVKTDTTAQATQTATALVGPFTDMDGDGVAGIFDNCTSVVNPDQRDTDGDGYGNMCDGDLNNDGATNTIDLNIYKAVHRSRLGDPNYNPDADFNGDGAINTIDLNIYKGLHRKPPGPSGLRP